jgi:hypothetical protein
MSSNLTAGRVGGSSKDDAIQSFHLTNPSKPPADILIDGCISYMLGPRVSECYFSCLFKERIQSTLLRWNVRYWPGACFTSQGVLTAAAEALIRDEHQHPEWLIDYDARDLKGTVVPQALWVPRSQNATTKFVLDAVLQLPIFFVCSDGTVGLPLQEAIEGPGRTLLWAQQPAPVGRHATFHLRIKVSSGSPHSPPVSPPRDDIYCRRSKRLLIYRHRHLQ